MRRLFFMAFGMTLIIFAMIGAATIGYAVTDRAPPIVYENGKALSESVPQAGQVEIEFTVFRTRICDGDAERWITDSNGVRHSIPSFTVSGAPPQLAGRETYIRTITLPNAIALGPASYQVTITYFCNPIHRLGWPIIVKSPPVLFEVTPRNLIVLPPLGVPQDQGDG